MKDMFVKHVKRVLLLLPGEELGSSTDRIQLCRARCDDGDQRASKDYVQVKTLIKFTFKRKVLASHPSCNHLRQ